MPDFKNITIITLFNILNHTVGNHIHWCRVTKNLGTGCQRTPLLESSSKYPWSALGKGDRSWKLSSCAAYKNQIKILSRDGVFLWNHIFNFYSLKRLISTDEYLEFHTRAFQTFNMVLLCSLVLSLHPSSSPLSSLSLLSHTALKGAGKKCSAFSLAYCIFCNL